MGNTQKVRAKAHGLLEKCGVDEHQFVRLYNKYSYKSEELLQAVDTDVGFFHEGNWKSQNIEKIVPFIHSWNVSSLFLSGNYEPTIILQISHISFQNVTCLWLCQNDIESLEELARVQFPSLVSLRCDSNKITKTKVLRKASWPKLRNMDLSKNYLTDGSSLTQMNIKNLTSLDIRYQRSWRNEDRNWILKVNSMNFRSLNFTAEISNEKVNQKMLQNWQYLNTNQ